MLSLIEKVAPGTFMLLNRRYNLLRLVDDLAPIGRRALAERLGTTERVLRSDIDVLKEQGLITTSSVGTDMTSSGYETLKKLQILMEQYIGSQQKEKQLAAVLNIQQCVIISGDSDGNEKVLKKLGESAVEVIDSLLPPGKQIVAVMGGTTMNTVSEVIDKQFGKHRDLLFIAARGGLGESVEIQANTVAEKMARRTGGRSRLLHAPESVRSETYSLLLEEPEIKETLAKLRQASLVLYSIGGAFEMAERRGLSHEALNLLIEEHAVAEAFGEFVDADGEVIYKLSRIGLHSEDLASIEKVVAVAGGRNKAQAIKAHMKTAPPHTWLVTDEAAANAILNGGNPLK